MFFGMRARERGGGEKDRERIDDVCCCAVWNRTSDIKVLWPVRANFSCLNIDAVMLRNVSTTRPRAVPFDWPLAGPETSPPSSPRARYPFLAAWPPDIPLPISRTAGLQWPAWPVMRPWWGWYMRREAGEWSIEVSRSVNFISLMCIRHSSVGTWCNLGHSDVPFNLNLLCFCMDMGSQGEKHPDLRCIYLLFHSLPQPFDILLSYLCLSLSCNYIYLIYAKCKI